MTTLSKIVVHPFDSWLEFEVTITCEPGTVPFNVMGVVALLYQSGLYHDAVSPAFFEHTFRRPRMGHTKVVWDTPQDTPYVKLTNRWFSMTEEPVTDGDGNQTSMNVKVQEVVFDEFDD